MGYIIYGKNNCQACQTAKNILTKKGIDFSYKTLSVDFSLGDFMGLTSQRSFPLIMKGSDVIGTLENLKKHLGEGSE